MTGDNICTLHQHPPFIGKYFEHFPGLFYILVISGNDYYRIAFFNVKLRLKSFAHFIWLLAVSYQL